MDDIKSVLSGFDNNFLKLLIFDLSKSGFLKSQPVNQWNTRSIAFIFSPNWLLNEVTLWKVVPSLEDVVHWRKYRVSLQLIDTWRSRMKTSVSSAMTQTDFAWGLQLYSKKDWHRCFLVSFAKFLRTPFLQNTSGRLLLTLAKWLVIIIDYQIHNLLQCWYSTFCVFNGRLPISC